MGDKEIRLIDANALKEYECSICDNRKRCEDREQVCSIIADIDEQPTIEAEPVKHGRWIRAEAKGYPVKRPSIWYCSECGEKIKYNDTLGRYQKTKKTVSQVNLRCRKCGARMDGEA